MEIGNPTALYFIWAAVAAALLYALELAWARRALGGLVSAGVLPKVIKGYSRPRKAIKRGLVVAALVLLVLSWAAPRVGKGMKMVKRQGADVVIALDLSSSMLAEDVKPNRLTAAKRAAETLVSRLGANRVALVGFADAAFIYCPLTLDASAVLMFLDYLSPDVIVDQGTDLADALAKSLDALKSSSGKGKAVLLVTDGEDHGPGLDEVRRLAADQGVRVYTLGVGTERGEPVPVFDAKGAVAGYKRDKGDNVVVSKLNTSVLAELARSTGGEHLVLGPGQAEISRLAADVQGLEKGVLEQRAFEHYIELFQIPLSLALALLVGESLLAEKRKSA
ncbi:MAG: VWA domain-containing protein [bacterium]